MLEWALIYSKWALGVLRLGVMGRDGAMGLRALYSACQLMHFLQQLLRAGHRGDGPPGTLQCRGAVRFGAGFLMCLVLMVLLGVCVTKALYSA